MQCIIELAGTLAAQANAYGILNGSRVVQTKIQRCITHTSSIYAKFDSHDHSYHASPSCAGEQKSTRTSGIKHVLKCHSWFAYISPTEPCLLEDVLVTPKHSLANQVHEHYLPRVCLSPPSARVLNMILNEAAAGARSYDQRGARYEGSQHAVQLGRPGNRLVYLEQFRFRAR